MKSGVWAREKFHLIGADSQVSGESFLGLIEQDGGSTGFKMWLCWVRPTSVKCFGQEGSGGGMQRRLALEVWKLACD